MKCKQMGQFSLEQSQLDNSVLCQAKKAEVNEPDDGSLFVSSPSPFPPLVCVVSTHY